MEKKLKLMRFWLVGIFVIIAAALFIFVWIFGAAQKTFTNISPILFSLGVAWKYWLGMAVLFVVVYFVYRAIVTKQK